MGGRTMPTECEHGVCIDGGDFRKSQRCSQCDRAADERIARGRALERLAERHPETFAYILQQELADTPKEDG